MLRRDAGDAGDGGQCGRCRGCPSVRVVTDVIDMDISLQGGDLLRADLLQYPRDKKPGSPAVRLLSTDDATYGVVRSGLRAADGRAEPTHLALYTAPASEFRLAPGAQELRVPLTWTDGQGVTVTKTYVFKPGQYAVEVIYDVQNASGADWNAASYVQFARHVYSQSRSMFDVESYAFRGPAVYDGKKYQKLASTRTTSRVPPGDQPMAGWRRCSITSSRLPCRRRVRPMTSRSSAKAAIRSSAIAAR